MSLAADGSWSSSLSFLTLILGVRAAAAALTAIDPISPEPTGAESVFFFWTRVTLMSLPRPISVATFGLSFDEVSFDAAAFAVDESSVDDFDFSTIVTLTPDAKSRDVSRSC
jgi:hypothetical protein